MKGTKEEFKQWLDERPECVRKLAEEFPFGTTFEDSAGEKMYLIGYTESDCLILSPINPDVDYDGAIARKHYAHASCIREHFVPVH